MMLAPLLAPLVGFLLREIVVKFVVFTSIFALVAVLVPVVVGYLTPWLTGSTLTSAFSGIPGSVWFFLDAFNLGFGVPLVLSAYITRFIIRRLPVVG